MTDQPSEGTLTYPSKEDEPLLNGFLDTLNTIVLVLDGQGRIIFFNSAARRVSGYLAEQLAGRPLWDLLVAPPDRPAIRDTLESVIEWGFPHESEQRWERPDGSPVYLRLTYTLVGGDDGGKRIFCTGVDLSDRAAMQTAVERRARSLAFSNKELEAFTFSVSHDIRAPLRTITYLAENLLEDYRNTLDTEAVDHLCRIRSSAVRMREVVDGLLRLFRVSQQESERVEIDLSEIADTIIEELRAREPNRRVEVHIEPNLIANGDRSLMDVAMSNLLGNAWKYTRDSARPVIRVGRYEDRGETVYYVEDNGTGFDAGQGDDPFTPFKRMHTDGGFEGTGIGLAMVERVIRKQGGRIWYRTAVGEGATFMFTLT